MQKKNLLLQVLSIFLITFSAIAQQEHNHQGKLCFICKKSGIAYNHEPPYKALSLKRELPILAGTVGLAITSSLLKAPTPLTLTEINALDKNDLNRFDRYATSQNSIRAKKVSDIFLTGVLILPTLFLSNHYTRKDILPLLAMSGEVILINVAITDIVKKLARRTRPLVYNPNFSLEEKMESNARVSFFSGHTSHTAALSFLFAKVINDYHPEAKRSIKIGVWTFAAAIPAITGYLRIRAGKHFPTDTITGFMAGGLVGILIPHFHRKKNIVKNQKVILTPSLGVGMASLQLRF